MIGEHPIKQLLSDTRAHWDHEGTPVHVRDTFWKIIHCGTIALGAEVYASEIESKLVFHTCKSRFCTSCGQRATEAWQQDLEAVLPDIPYVGITLTLPMQFRTILQQNRHILHDIPAMGADAIQQWAWARYCVRLIISVVQQTFGGRLNFVSHLHIMVSAGGLKEFQARWIHRVQYHQRELMLAWRFAVGALLSEAFKKGMLRCNLSGQEFRDLLETQHRREWNIFISRSGSKAYWLKHDGRYLRRPPVAQHRLARVGIDRVEYQAKDTRNKRRVLMHYTNEEFVGILAQHVPDSYGHAVRYFGLLAPRCKARLWAAVFVLLNQQQRPHPPRLRWRWLRFKTFGTDPLLDSQGQLMQWSGRRKPAPAPACSFGGTKGTEAMRPWHFNGGFQLSQNKEPLIPHAEEDR
jgi:Putative transposase/Transposase zinc-binding domain